MWWAEPVTERADSSGIFVKYMLCPPSASGSKVASDVEIDERREISSKPKSSDGLHRSDCHRAR